MGIKLVEEVMDWCPDDVTPAQRWCLTVLARDANDATRETYHGPEHPEILRRVRMSAKRWESVRSELLKRGLIEPVSGGFRGQAGRYRIASMFAPCVVADWRKTPENRGAFGGYAPTRPKKDPRVPGVNHTKRPPEPGGQSAERPPESGGPTPPSLSSSFSPPLNNAPTAAPDRSMPPAPPGERETPATPINDQAQQIANTWTAARGGRRNPAAERQVANTAAELLLAGWTTDDLTALAQDMAAKYPTGRDLTRHADHWQPPTLASGPAGTVTVLLPPPCPRCEADYPGARFNAKLRVRNDQPCPDCHPDAAPAAA